MLSALLDHSYGLHSIIVARDEELRNAVVKACNYSRAPMQLCNDALVRCGENLSRLGANHCSLCEELIVDNQHEYLAQAVSVVDVSQR